MPEVSSNASSMPLPMPLPLSLPPPPSVASAATIKSARALIQRVGMTRASRLLGINRATVANLVAGFSVKPGTLALAEMRLRAVADAEASKI